MEVPKVSYMVIVCPIPVPPLMWYTDTTRLYVTGEVLKSTAATTETCTGSIVWSRGSRGSFFAFLRVS